MKGGGGLSVDAQWNRRGLREGDHLDNCRAGTMTYKNFVEIGRAVVMVYGPLYGKLVVILDVVDQNRVLVEGPKCSGFVPRQVVHLKRVKLTNIKINVPRQARPATLNKIAEEAKLGEQWTAASFAKKLAKQETRAAATDFDRFKTMIAKKRRSYLLKKEFSKLGGKSLRKLVF